MRILIAPDKFRGTATAVEAATALAQGARDAGWDPVTVPLADGGEGTLEAFGGPNRTSVVTGPLGRPVQAAWRLHGGTAVIEMARASGLQLAGGPEHNDAIAATSRGTGQLIAEAVARGARRVIVGVGGSACTDGGIGAIEVLEDLLPLDGRDGPLMQVACDVTTPFLDAPRVFGPQKGATSDDVHALTNRLQCLAERYRRRYAVDVVHLPGSGAAGGLAGGLAALGAIIEPGFALISGVLGLRDQIRAADLVLTGEGLLDAQSFDGKVVGGVAAAADDAGVPWCAVVGAALVRPAGAPVIDLVSRFGRDPAFVDTARCLRIAACELLSARPTQHANLPLAVRHRDRSEALPGDSS